MSKFIEEVVDEMNKAGYERGFSLVKALDIINGERQDQYGCPEDSFELIAKYWQTYLNVSIKPHDVVMMMVLLKIAREQGQGKRDSIIDAIGYLGIYDDIVYI